MACISVEEQRMSEIDRCKQDIADIRNQLRREHTRMIEEKRTR